MLLGAKFAFQPAWAVVVHKFEYTLRTVQLLPLTVRYLPTQEEFCCSYPWCSECVFLATFMQKLHFHAKLPFYNKKVETLQAFGAIVVRELVLTAAAVEMIYVFFQCCGGCGRFGELKINSLNYAVL